MNDEKKFFTQRKSAEGASEFLSFISFIIHIIILSAQKLGFQKKYNRILGWTGWGIFSVFFLHPAYPAILLLFPISKNY